MVENNEWHTNLSEAFEVIKKLTAKGTLWHWSRSKNWTCKYISLRIDMRDGGYLLMDRDGQRISLEQLQEQFHD